MNEHVNTSKFIGRLGKDPEMQYLPTGNAVLNFSIAVNMVRYQEGEYVKETLWVDLTAFGKTAESAAKVLRKGTQVSVDASYGKRQYTDKEGKKRYAHDFTVRSFHILSSPNTNGASESAVESADEEVELAPF
jgi:single-strand DNA-binding protein